MDVWVAAPFPCDSDLVVVIDVLVVVADSVVEEAVFAAVESGDAVVPVEGERDASVIHRAVSGVAGTSTDHGSPVAVAAAAQQADVQRWVECVERA